MLAQNALLMGRSRKESPREVEQGTKAWHMMVESNPAIGKGDTAATTVAANEENHISYHLEVLHGYDDYHLIMNVAKVRAISKSMIDTLG